MALESHLLKRAMLVLPILAFSLLSSCQSIYILPQNFTDVCPQAPCSTLNNVFANKRVATNVSSMELLFLPGRHILSRSLLFNGAIHIGMRGDCNNSQCSPVIECQGLASIWFFSVQTVTINDITFLGCTDQQVVAFGGAFAITKAQTVLIVNCHFYYNKAVGQSSGFGGAFTVTESIYVNIMGCFFHNNSVLCENANKKCGSNFVGSSLAVLNCHNTSIIQCQFVQTQKLPGALYSQSSNMTIVESVFHCTYTDSTSSYVVFGGAAYLLNSSVQINRSSFSGLIADHGGAIFASATRLFIFDTSFRNNTGTLYAGAIKNTRSSVFIFNSELVNNRAGHGSVIHSVIDSIFVSVNNTYLNNTATFNGGIYAESNSTIISSYNIYSGNKGRIGAVHYILSGSISASGDVYIENRAVLIGIIFCFCLSPDISCNLHLANNTIEENTVNQGIVYSYHCNTSDHNNVYIRNSGGAAIAQNVRSLQISGSSFLNNTSKLSGIIINEPQAVTTITGALFDGNSAADGSTMFIQSHWLISISKTDFLNNQASVGGAIAYISNTPMEKSGLLLVTNCSFIGNDAPDPAGGTVIVREVAIELVDCSLHNNTGGALVGDNANLSVQNCSFHKNKGGYGGTAVNIIGGSIFIDQSLFSMNNGAIISSNRGAVNCSNCIFVDNQSFLFGPAIAVTESGTLLAKNCLFRGNRAITFGGAIGGYNNGPIVLENCTFDGNTASRGGAIAIVNGQATCSEASFLNNTSLDLGGAVYIQNGMFTSRISNFMDNLSNNAGGSIATLSSDIFVNNCTNVNNSAVLYGGAVFSASCLLSPSDSSHGDVNRQLIRPLLLFLKSKCGEYNYLSNFTTSESILWLSDTLLTNNTCLSAGGAVVSIGTQIFADNSTTLLFATNKAKYGGGLTLIWSNFSLNTVVEVRENNAHLSGGGFFLYLSAIKFNGATKIIQNTASLHGGGVYGLGSKIEVIGQTILFDRNSAMLGGAVYFANSSNLKLLKNEQRNAEKDKTSIIFSHNIATKGGAILVLDTSQKSYCTNHSNECFIATYNANNSISANTSHFNIIFNNNSASISGADIFGGLLDRCYLSPSTELVRAFPKYSSSNGIDYIRATAQFVGLADYSTLIVNYNPDQVLEQISTAALTGLVSSDPVQVCYCIQNKPNCHIDHPTVRVVKGRFFQVYIAAVDQAGNYMNSTIISSIISNRVIINVDQIRQSIPAECSYLGYIVSPKDESSSTEIELFADGPCQDVSSSKRILNVIFEPCTCPIGFVPMETQTQCNCVCDPALADYISGCSFENQTVFRNPNVWIDLINTSSRTGYLLYRDCPFDYCINEAVSVNLNKERGADSQCAFNHSGILCGACGKNLSAVLGSSNCRQCSSSYISLILPFAAAGIALVAFIMVFNMTVTSGTINGLIFYANIVFANRSLFIPPQTPQLFVVFISWLNLDLGIETCFYDGMDSYAKVPLQIVFPVYLIILTVVMMVIQKNSLRFAGLIGKKMKPAEAFCTLILLSYSKFICTIIASLQYTYLDYPDGSREIVWLYDANVPYFTLSHVPRFIGAALIIILGVVYTTLLLFGQWLPERKGFMQCRSFVSKYNTPLKSKWRSWVGLLLVARVILHLISATMSESVFLLVVLCIILLLLLFKLVVGNVYKTKAIGLLESSFLFNLGIFSSTLFLVRERGSGSIAIVYLSLSLTFLLFLCIIGYHVYISIVRATCVRCQQNLRALTNRRQNIEFQQVNLLEEQDYVENEEPQDDPERIDQPVNADNQDVNVDPPIIQPAVRHSQPRHRDLEDLFEPITEQDYKKLNPRKKVQPSMTTYSIV